MSTWKQIKGDRACPAKTMRSPSTLMEHQTMVIRWLLGLPTDDDGELDDDWEEVGELERQAFLNQDDRAYQAFRQKERETNSKQRESDRKDASKAPGDK